MHALPRHALLAVALAIAACRGDATGPGMAAVSAARAERETDEGSGPRYSDWSEGVNLGPIVNSASEDMGPAISRDGLSLYFSSARPATGMGIADLWVAHRPSVDAPWESPQALDALNVPGSVAENGPALSPDGHRIYFQSNRPGGFGAQDLYVSRRRDKRDDSGWEAPVNLGAAINTSASETGPEYFEDERSGTATLYFTSNRPGGPGGNDIYASTVLPDGTFAPPVLVAELSSPADDQGPTIRRDGLEMLLASNRPGTLGGMDIWVATRASTSDPWSTPVNLGAAINTENIDASPALSFDARTLYFHAALRPGSIGGEGRFDILAATRSKLTKPDE